MILVVSVTLRVVLHRAIDRLTCRISDGKAPSWLRRARKRGVQRSADDQRLQSAERLAQRARTIGSLLRSVSTFVIYGVAFVMILAEFGIDIAPILASAGVLGLAIGF